mgnify:FL=1
MKENLIHYRTCVCNINYHMVWSVKFRRKILNAEVEACLQELVQETMYTVLCQPLRNYHNCNREIPEGDLRQETF